jgi:hypothetical protein
MLNEEQTLEPFMELLITAIEDLDPTQRERFGARICDELRTNPRFP